MNDIYCIVPSPVSTHIASTGGHMSPSRAVRSLFVLLPLVVLALPRPNAAQTQGEQGYLTDIGKPNFAVNLPVENGALNVGNGNLLLEFPIASVPQRGNLRYTAKLAYNSRIWQYPPTARRAVGVDMADGA